MAHYRSGIILATVVFTVIVFVDLAQADPIALGKPSRPGLPECQARVAELEAQVATLQALLDAMKNYAPVPQTGQTKCYDPYGEAEIPCANTGQDGDLQKGIASPIPRFTDNNNGTVTDNLTRLVWMKNAHRWDPMHWDVGVNACRQLADDGSSLTDGSQAGDWRMPNLREAMSLLDFGNNNPALPVDHLFDNIWDGNYWTSTAHPPSSYVYFLAYTRTISSESNGYIGVRGRVGDYNLVWCVRDP